MSSTVNLYDAKTQLSSLVERAAAGEEIIIAKNGVPRAKLAPIARDSKPRQPAHAIGLTHLADDFDELDPAIQVLFEG